MEAYEAYLFDLYGTLVDIHTDEDQPSHWARMAGLLARHGAAYRPGDLRAAYLQAVGEAEALLRERHRDIPGACPEIDIAPVFRRLYAEKGVAADERLVADTALAFRRSSLTHLRLYAGAAELLRALRERSQVLLASNAQSLFTRPELEELGIAGLFDAIWISSEQGVKKPDPRFYRSLLAARGLRPERCLMIGNDPICDGEGARAAGLDAWVIRSGLSPRDLTAGYDQQGMDLKRLRRMLCG